MEVNPRCMWCGGHSESMLHVLRDCDDTQILWTNIINPSVGSIFFSLDLVDWMKFNIRNPSDILGDDWSVLFSTICWLIWKRRNERIFQGKWHSNTSLLSNANYSLNTLRQASTKLQGINLHGQIVLEYGAQWSPPQEGWLKLNVDGAFSHHHGTGCGGILRDYEGNLISGFMFHPSNGDSLTAEIWALLWGLKMAWDSGERKIIVETDAADVIRLLYQDVEEYHTDEGLIQQALVLLNQQWEIEVVQISRTANTFADYLAKTTISTGVGFNPFSTVTEDMEQFMLKDKNVSHSDVVN